MVQDDFKQVGIELQKRRKELNISLKEVENTTSIRIAHLQAIEEGDLSRLLSPIYARGFVKQYAAFLGLDGEKLVEENQQCFRSPEPHEFSYGIGTLEMRTNPGSHVRWIPNFVWLAAFAALIILAWLIARFFEVF
jgi:cytoskeletal protein RodZ